MSRQRGGRPTQSTGPPHPARAGPAARVECAPPPAPVPTAHPTRWRTAPGVGWRVLPATERPWVLVHQARFGLGDTLWLTPLLRGLGRLWPGCRTVVVGPPVAEALLGDNPWVREVLPFDPDASPSGRRGIAARLADRRIGLGLFGFARRPESRWLVEWASDAGVAARIDLEYTLEEAPHRPRSLGATHEGRIVWGRIPSPVTLLRLLEPLVDPGRRRHRAILADARLEYRPPANADNCARRTLRQAGLGRRPYALVAPGGDSAERWPEDRFARLVRWLAERYELAVLVDGAPSEAKLRRRIVRRAVAGATHPIHVLSTPIAEHYALLAGARLLVANDSGPIHLAAIAGTPTVYLTDVGRRVHSRSEGGGRWAIADSGGGGAASLPLAAVRAAIERLARSGRLDLDR